MRVVKSESGVFSAYSQCSVAPNDEYLLFKKCSDIFYYYEPLNPHQNKDLRLFVEDVVHRRDSIFDFAHLSDGRFVVLLQSSSERVHLAEASINLDEALVRISNILKEDIEIRTKGGQSRLIRDECGPVLVNFPNNFADESPQSRTVKLFHVGDFVEHSIDVIKNVRIDRRIGVNELWCDPFIFRNSIYFFNQLGSELLCISMTENSPTSSLRSRFSARLVRTHASAIDTYSGERPCSRFFRRDTIIFDHFVLVYFSQLVGDIKSRRLSKKNSIAETKSLWKLWMDSLVWESVDTPSEVHFPTNRISFKQSNQNSSALFLHGQCGQLGCSQRQHFFEIEVMENIGYQRESPIISNDPVPKRPTVLRRFVKFASGKKSQNEPLYKKTAASLAKSVSCHSLINQRTNEDNRSVTSEQIFGKTNSTFNLVNWSRHMASSQNPSENRLSEQLKYAKEMGYSDVEIWGALDLTNRNTQKAYEPFNSMNAMIDALSAVQKKDLNASTSNLTNSSARFNGSTVTLPVYFDEGKREEERLPGWTSSSVQSHQRTHPSFGSNVSRSMSFNESHGMRRSLAQSMGSLTMAIPHSSRVSNGKSSVQRLIDTFENENRRHFEEFQRINNELRRKLENSVRQEESLSDILRLRQETIRKQEVLLKSQTDTEKRLESANRRIQDLLKDLQLREADIMRQQGDYDALKRRHEAETRKADEAKQTLNSEISRLDREKEDLMRENETLREEVESKNVDLSRLIVEKRELEENQVQGPVCGVCMDNRREVIFFPCLHLTCCKQCANSIDQCSICRVRIMGKIEFFQ